MTGGWGQGDRTTSEHFKPVETFPERFESYLRDIAGMGFDAVDIWTAIINPAWATDAHLDAAKDLLAKHNLRVVSMAGYFGDTAEILTATCRIANALDCDILGGSTRFLYTDRDTATGILRDHGVKLGIENHPEKNPAELLEKIGDGADGFVGAAVDTGWFGTQGYDAARALRELKDHLLYVHLKDVRAAGEHETCRFGEGVVPMKACVDALKDIGYTGAVCVEHEPETFDPTEDVIASRDMLKEWFS